MNEKEPTSDTCYQYECRAIISTRLRACPYERVDAREKRDLEAEGVQAEG